MSWLPCTINTQRKRPVAVGEPDAALAWQPLRVEAPILRASPSGRAGPSFDQREPSTGSVTRSAFAPNSSRCASLPLP